MKAYAIFIGCIIITVHCSVVLNPTVVGLSLYRYINTARTHDSDNALQQFTPEINTF